MTISSRSRTNALGAGFGSNQIRSRQDNDEFFAPIAADKILGTKAAHKKRGSFA